MRVIKFRAWDGTNMFEVAQITFNESAWSCDKGRGVSIPFQPHITLMQFTGLKDDNKVEIYDGDIVEDILGNRLLVEWNDDTCQFQFSDGSPINDSDRYATHKLVIGNIYETPELLNDKK